MYTRKHHLIGTKLTLKKPKAVFDQHMLLAFYYFSDFLENNYWVQSMEPFSIDLTYLPAGVSVTNNLC